MKALAAQSLSGVPTDTERGFIDAEFQELRSEITDMATTTRFNGQSLLDGTAPGADYFVGTDVSDTITVAFPALAAATGAFPSTALGLVVTAGPLEVHIATAAATAMPATDKADRTSN